MKVLWLTSNPNVYEAAGGIVGGGWVAALARRIVERNDVELAIAVPSCVQHGKDVRGRITFYPTLLDTPRLERLVPYRFSRKRDMAYCHRLLAAIDDFQPDVIHIWGSESCLGLVQKLTAVPCVLHIQGVISACNNVYFPPNVSMCRVFWTLFCHNPFHGLLRFYRHIYRGRRFFYLQAEREQEICRTVGNYIGRTDWDKNVLSVLSPGARYFYGSEMLRDEIMKSRKWVSHAERHKLIISSVVRNDLYKGHDVILRAAKHLKNLYGDFEWNIYGNTPIDIQERLAGISAADVNVVCCGSVNADALAQALLDSDVFCHPSYIENSSNAICEAQVLGVPVIATDGGGTATLLKGGAGLLVPTNDDYQMAVCILQLKGDRHLSYEISRREIESATERHNPDQIVSGVVKIYSEIIGR